MTIEEDFKTGEYIEKEYDIESEYHKYMNKRKNVILYQWGVFVTAIAAWNLYRLGKCVDYEHGGIWAYSDTDSCYSNFWNMQKIEEYNQDCIRRLKANNYDTVLHNGKEYNLGVATFDGSYSEYIYLGAKRYCGRDAGSGKLKITVAGVPKKNGALCLNDDINNFKQGFCFPGSITGKLTHSYIYAEDIYKDKNGNEVADSIDLNECSYNLDQEQLFDFNEYVEVDEYEASNFR